MVGASPFPDFLRPTGFYSKLVRWLTQYVLRITRVVSLTLPTPVTSFTPILLNNAGGGGGGDRWRTPQNPVLGTPSSSALLRRWGEEERFSFWAALEIKEVLKILQQQLSATGVNTNYKIWYNYSINYVKKSCYRGWIVVFITGNNDDDSFLIL